MIDTCQANTMYTKFYSPNIFAVGSSDLGENSYSVSRFFFLLSMPRFYLVVTHEKTCST